MGAKEAVDFLIEDHGDVGNGFREDFAQDKPYKSILQRNGKTLDEVLKLFDWKDDCDKWVQEYNKQKQDMEKLIRYRRMVSFCIGGWRLSYTVNISQQK